jgi:hypothetical protein
VPSRRYGHRQTPRLRCPQNPRQKHRPRLNPRWPSSTFPHGRTGQCPNGNGPLRTASPQTTSRYSVARVVSGNLFFRCTLPQPLR